MPTAWPLTAATIGFAARLMVRRKTNTGVSSPSGGRWMKSAMSLPAVNAPSAWPRTRITRTEGSASALSNASVSSVYICAVIAFLRWGRLNSISRTGPSRDTRISMVSLAVVAVLVDDRRDDEAVGHEAHQIVQRRGFVRSPMVDEQAMGAFDPEGDREHQ